MLIFDQCEKSPNLRKEASILDSLVRQIEDWPLHVILGSRADKEPRAEIEDLQVNYPELAELRSLGVMNLEDPRVAVEMLSWPRQRVPITQELAEDDLLGLIGGYPRVLARWSNPENARRMRTRGPGRDR